MPEVIPIGADHAGFQMKERLVDESRTLGYEPLDVGPHGPARGAPLWDQSRHGVRREAVG